MEETVLKIGDRVCHAGMNYSGVITKIEDDLYTMTLDKPLPLKRFDFTMTGSYIIEPATQITKIRNIVTAFVKIEDDDIYKETQRP